MNTQTNRIENATDNILDDARDLVVATADVVEDKVVQARNRLSAAMAAAGESCAAAQKKAVESAKAADKAIRANPYPAIGIALGVGALVGYLLRRRA
jgi:ElaB/YqjD/DUF883 family membrane-anchored ribosome-binding protein